ncbi:hypothetical protein E2C01_039248 [Portunus trituberculatus]|uniref:Uncharacterized protein n=1 Tax=Portunus trituberculatus TaxID=210409 RepID=A0A5B7FJD1_PORTR|nr:hypothetical protein [Portunus trituberculatus]
MNLNASFSKDEEHYDCFTSLKDNSNDLGANIATLDNTTRAKVKQCLPRSHTTWQVEADHLSFGTGRFDKAMKVESPKLGIQKGEGWSV